MMFSIVTGNGNETDEIKIHWCQSDKEFVFVKFQDSTSEW